MTKEAHMRFVNTDDCTRNWSGLKNAETGRGLTLAPGEEAEVASWSGDVDFTDFEDAFLKPVGKAAKRSQVIPANEVEGEGAKAGPKPSAIPVV